MELVYLYAGHLGKGIENTGINFSKNFEVTYDLANSRISIQIRKVTEERKKLFGKNIEDISVIVGKNGAGKSTIMRLLGLPRIEYLDYFGFHDEKGIHSWFAVYHLRDNEFIIEGSYSPILAGNFDDANGDETESKHGIMPIYCISFRYDLDRKSDEPSLFTDITQMEVSGSSAYDERFKDIFLLFFGNPAGVSWFDDYTPTQRILVNNDNRLRRVVSDRSSLTSIMRYLLRTQDDENDYSKRIGNLPGVAIRLELRRHQGFRGFDWIDVSSSEEITKRTDFSKEIAQKIYLSRDIVPLWSYDGTNGNSGFSHKKHFILAYLEDLVYEYIEEYTNNTGDDDYSQAIKPFANSDELEYEKRKVFLNEHLYEVCREGYFAEVVEKLETIPAKYFLANNILEIPLRKEKECSVPEIIGLLDENEHDKYYSYIKLRNKEFLHCIFTGMSSGEAHFIDVLSSVDGALENWKYNNKADENYGKTCVLLMDEPDTSFHPEWSRSFIKNLVDYLNSKDVPFKFQVIITTHSPLMLSDIPSDSIYCLAKNNEGKHEVKRPAFGFLSGINDLLVDGFFTESVFGQFAEDYANDLIKQIEKMENAFITGKMDSASDEEEYQKILRRVYVLDEGIVRRSLVNRLERIHYWYRVRTGAAMIKVEVKDPDVYKDWYLDNVFSKLRDRITKTITVFRSQLTLYIMPNLADEQTLKDILTMHPHDLEKKYKWIHAYSYFVRNVDANRGDPTNKDYLEELEKFNKDISNYLNYEFLDRFFKGLRPELVRRLGVKVCPYCNQQYVNYLEDDRYNGYLGDLDHIRPKSLYPLFSMSLYNLIPVCKPCNQLFKKAKTPQFFNPYERGFGDDVSLYLKYKNVRQIVGLEEVDDLEWWIDPACSADEKVLFQNEIQLFKLDGVYRSHKKEIQIALKKRDEYTKRFLRLVYSRLPLGLLMDYRLEYGVSFDKDKYQDEMMSKAINDVVFKN